MASKEIWAVFRESHTGRMLFQVIVKTSTQYQLQQKKNKLYVPNIKKLNINFYSDVSEKVKVQKQPDDWELTQVLIKG